MTWTTVLLKVLLTGVVILALGSIFSLLFIALRRWLTVRADKEHMLHLANGGNCRSLYFLTVSSPEPSLAFTLLNNKVPLVELRELESEDEPQPGPVVPETKSTSTATAANPGAPIKALQKASQKAGSAASWLGAIGGFLPGKLGHRFRGQAAKVREVQASSSRAAYAPGRFGRKMGAVQKRSESQAAARRTDDRASAPLGPRIGSTTQVDYRVQTAELLPGEALSLTLRVGTRVKRYPVGSFNYTVLSEQTALDFPDLDTPAVVKSGTVSFEPTEEWRYWLLPAANISLLLLTLVTVIYSLSLLWR